MKFTRQQTFVLAVQAAAIVKDIRDGRDLAASLVEMAAQVPSRDLARFCAHWDLGTAAKIFVDEQYGQGGPWTSWLLSGGETPSELEPA